MNKAILIGNLTRDPEVRTTGSGTTVCTFTIAVNRRFQNQAGERVSDFFNIVAWRQLGELCGKYLSKGRKVSVIGEIQNRSYDAKDGSKRYSSPPRARRAAAAAAAMSAAALSARTLLPPRASLR